MARHMCTHCHRSFTNITDLKNHSRAHTGEKPFKCEDCDASFAKRYGLTRHRHFHTGEKPFECKECDMAFSESFKLVLHARTRTEEKPYTCGVCSKEFRSERSFTDHKVTHIDVTPWTCEFCSLTFKVRKSLIRHRKHKHLPTKSSEPVHSAENIHNSELSESVHLVTVPHTQESLDGGTMNCRDMDENVLTDRDNEGVLGLADRNGDMSEGERESPVTHTGENHDGIYGDGIDIDTTLDKEDINETTSEAKLAENEVTHTGEKPYKCEQCDMAFSGSFKLILHARTHTGEKPYTCDVCKKEFPTPGHLMRHEKTHTGERPFECDECGMACATNSRLTEHKKIHSELKPWTCELCPQAFRRKYNMLQHQRTHSGEKPFECDECGMACPTKSRLTKHKAVHSEIKPWTCEFCSKTFRKRYNLTHHRKIHTRIKVTFPCSLCEESFSRESRLRTHLLTHAGENQEIGKTPEEVHEDNVEETMETDGDDDDDAKTPIIRKHRVTNADGTAGTSQNDEHLLSHPIIKLENPCTQTEENSDDVCVPVTDESTDLNTGTLIVEKAFKCEHCDFRSSSMYQLGIHVDLAHSEDSIFFCEFCNCRFANKDTLKRHRRTHTGEKPYKCDSCDAEFNQQDNFVRHLRTHIGENSYKCPHCVKSFTETVKFSQHLKRVHPDYQNEFKPFKCEICDSCFHLKRALNNHMGMHTGEKPYVCEDCNTAFASQSNLERHRRNHSGEKPYRCSLCVKSFAEKTNLEGHVKRMHQKNEDKEWYRCEDCCIEFTDSRRLARHYYRMHTGDNRRQEHVENSAEPCTCRGCRNRTTSTVPLFSCDLCDQGFVTQNGLKRHLYNHENDVYGSLNTHTGENPNTHTGENPNTHTGENPNTHTGENPNTHTGENPYTQTGDYPGTHTGENPLTCDVCAESFSRNSQLTIHRIRKIAHDITANSPETVSNDIYDPNNSLEITGIKTEPADEIETENAQREPFCLVTVKVEEP